MALAGNAGETNPYIASGVNFGGPILGSIGHNGLDLYAPARFDDS